MPERSEGMSGDDKKPHAYSTQISGDSESGYHADGYNVVIDPHALSASIDTYKSQLQGQGVNDLVRTMMTSLVPQDAFGKLPSASAAYSEMSDFVNSHAAQMRAMGVSLEDFVARVQAAAHYGYEVDPATRRIAAVQHRMGME
jgi:hypothetical protein